MSSLFKHTNGFYYLKYSQDGVDKRISTKCRSKAEANLFLRSFDPKIKSAIRLDVLRRVCLDHSLSLNEGMQWQYSDTWERFYAKYGNILLSEISKVDIDNFIKDLRNAVSKKGKPFSEATINMNISVLKKSFNIAVDSEWLTVNPVRVKKSKVERTRPAFRINEAELILNELTGQYHQIVRVAFNTGIRRSALCDLEWKDIDFEQGKIYLKNKMDKHLQFVPINPVTRAILQERLKIADISGKVFSVNSGYLGKVVKKVCLKLGLNSKLTFHSIRHTFGTKAVKDYGLRIAKEMLNHSDINTTMIYSHVLEEELIEAIQGYGI